MKVVDGGFGKGQDEPPDLNVALKDLIEAEPLSKLTEGDFILLVRDSQGLDLVFTNHDTNADAVYHLARLQMFLTMDLEPEWEFDDGA